jgi:hypothetical protein
MTFGWFVSSRTTCGAASLDVCVETCCGSNRNNGNEEQDDGIVSSGWLAAGTAARKMWVKW